MTGPLLERVAARLLNTPLLITPEYGSVITTVLAERIGVEPMVASDVVESYKRPNVRSSFDARTGIATVPIVGGLVHRGDGPDAASGVEGYTSIHNRLSELFGDDKTRGVLVDLDSHGGEAAGLQELASWIPVASKQAGKPVWVIANATAASAAYWLGTAGDRFYAAPGASRIGSVGVVVQHVDMSKAAERRGIVMSFIFAGDHKVDGHPFAALPDDVRASMQARVDRLYDGFVEAVAENRGLDPKVIRGTQARVYGPEEARELRLVDGVAGLGSVLTAFATHLKPAQVGYTKEGANMAAKDLIYDQTDLDKAKAEGVASATSTVTGLKDQLKEAADDRKALLAAFTEVAGDNPKVAIFVEALNEGGSVALASKMAAKIETPKVETQSQTRTDAQVDAFMRAHAPNVNDDGGAEPNADAKAARLADLQQSMKAFNGTPSARV